MANRPTMECLSDEQVRKKAQEGNHDAFMELMSRLLPDLYPWCRQDARKIGFPEYQVDDVCQEAIVKASVNASRRFARGEQFSEISVEWLRRIALNLMRNQLKRERRNRGSAGIGMIEPSTHDQGANLAEEEEQLIMFFQWLPADQRDLLRLVYIDGVDIAEAGSILDLSKWNAYKLHERAIELLRDYLREHYYGQ